MTFRRLLTAVAIAVTAVCAMHGAEKSDGLKPRWITSSLPRPASPGYIFISAQGQGATLDEARQRALVNLTAKLEHERGLEITSTLSVDKRASRTGGRRNSESSQTYSMTATERGKTVTLTTRVVDEYWERKGRTYTVTQLYTVNDLTAPGTGSYSDRITLTTRYGAGPVFMSLIPGVGQMYKGSNLKGGLIMGGAVVCAAAIITSESLRASYVNKRAEYPQHFDFYHKRATDWRNARNVCIGVGAALYVYNLIDAAVAPGRRQVKVKRGPAAPRYSLAPAIMADPQGPAAGGLAFTVTF